MVQIIDNPLQLNPAQSAAMGAQFVAPVTDALVRNGQNQLDIAKLHEEQLFAQKTAQAQHAMQIERERMRDERATKVAQLAADSHMQLLKQKGAFDDIKTAQGNLVNQLGGEPVTRMAGETDDAFLSRIQQATKAKLVDNIKSDSLAKSNIDQQIAAQNNYLSDPRIQSVFQKAASDPIVKNAAAGAAQSGLQNWIQNLPQDQADQVRAAVAQNPNQAAAIFAKSGYDYTGAYNQALMAETAKALKASGNPVAANIATARDNLNQLYKQRQSLSMMGSVNGRQVEKPWNASADNAADVHTTLAKDPNAKLVFDQDSRMWKLAPTTAAPVVPAPTAGQPVTPMVAPVVPAPSAATAFPSSASTGIAPMQFPSAPAFIDGSGNMVRPHDPIQVVSTNPAPAQPFVSPIQRMIAIPAPAAGAQFVMPPSAPQVAGQAPAAASVMAPPPQVVLPAGANVDAASIYQPLPTMPQTDSNWVNPLDAQAQAMAASNNWRAQMGQ